MSVLGVILVILYTAVGTWGVKYFKSEILGIVLEYDTITGHLVKPVIFGLLFGWIAAPISFLHWLFIGRNR